MLINHADGMIGNIVRSCIVIMSAFLHDNYCY